MNADQPRSTWRKSALKKNDNNVLKQLIMPNRCATLPILLILSALIRVHRD